MTATGFALVNADGSGVQQVPLPPKFEGRQLFPRDVSIAPDGRRLAFAADDDL